MTNQQRSRFIDVLTADDTSSATTRVMTTAFWFPRSGAVSSPSTQVIDLASRRASRAS